MWITFYLAALPLSRLKIDFYTGFVNIDNIMLNASKKNILYFLLILMIVVFAYFFVTKDYLSKKAPETASTPPLITDQATTTNSANIGVTGSGDFTVTPLSSGKADTAIQAPDLNREVVIPPIFTGEANTIMRNNILTTLDALRAGDTTLENWLKLGIYRKQIDDYEGAKLVWEYTAKVWPDDFQSYYNLGDIYHYYLKDYPKAEYNLKKSIELKPELLINYRNLFDLYNLSYEEKRDLAEDALLEGLGRNPDSIDMMVLLARYHRDNGHITEAKAYYQQGLDKSVELGLQKLQDLISEEISDLDTED